MNNLTPYLMFNGNCKEAFDFYKECLGGQFDYEGTYKDSPIEVSEGDQDKIMHIYLTFNGGALMGSDHIESAGYTTHTAETNIHLSLTFGTIEELYACFNKLKQGGSVTQELKEQFWGDTFGQIRDKYGFHWMLSYNDEAKQK